MVGVDEGTGIVHIAPGCGAEDFELGSATGPARARAGRRGRRLLRAVRLAARPAHAPTRRQPIIEDLGQRGRLLRAEELTHRYPICWRCGTELIFRVVDEWFISADGVRERMIEANRDVKWTPELYGKRMEDWLRNMGDWCISRKRYWGLPLPFYRRAVRQADGGRLGGGAARAGGRPVAVDGLEELHRPWIDGDPDPHRRTARSPSACRRSATAGSTRASCRSRRSAGAATTYVPEGYARGRRRGADEAPTCPTTPTGRSGSRPSGSPRCASRSASGSTRSCS